jgi:hypothetical protein
MVENLSLSVQADVIDIVADVPQKNDIFLVDTCVWLWQSYSNSTWNSKPDRLIEVGSYLNYLTQAASIGATLTYSGLSLVELASVIERTEWQIFVKNNYKLTLKEYRHNLPAERTKVVKKVELAWETVKSFAVSVDINVDEIVLEQALQRFGSQMLDGYDLLHLEAISQAGTGQIKIMTDDCDYCTAADIQLFTLNTSVITTANQQNKLVNRS